ncbi:hypothetical protein HDU88_005997 [Geranomyces variabilis]|nr:hypothetical protein HDU88_005997 [Geranomyces variabilis]
MPPLQLPYDVLVHIFSYIYVRPALSATLATCAGVSRAWFTAARWVAAHPRRGALLGRPRCDKQDMVLGPVYSSTVQGKLRVQPVGFEGVLRLMIHPTPHGGVLLSLRNTTTAQTVLLDNTNGLEALTSALRTLAYAAIPAEPIQAPLLQPPLEPDNPTDARWLFAGAADVGATVVARRGTVALISADGCATAWETASSGAVNVEAAAAPAAATVSCVCGRPPAECGGQKVGLFVGGDVDVETLEKCLKEAGLENGRFLFAVIPPSRTLQVSVEPFSEGAACSAPFSPLPRDDACTQTLPQQVPARTVFSTFTAQIYILPTLPTTCAHATSTPTFTVTEPNCTPTTTVCTQTPPESTKPLTSLSEILSTSEPPLHVLLPSQKYPAQLPACLSPRRNAYALMAGMSAVAMDFVGGRNSAVWIGDEEWVGVDGGGDIVALIGKKVLT